MCSAKMFIKEFCLREISFLTLISITLLKFGETVSINYGYTFFVELTNSTAGTHLDPACMLQVQDLQIGLRKREDWALEIVDSWGQIPAGILYGHSIEMGNFDECLEVAEKLDGVNDFNGKYCLSSVAIRTKYDKDLKFETGICMPATCNTGQMATALKEFVGNELYTDIGVVVAVVIEESDCYVREKQFKAMDWVAIGIFSCLGLILLMSTIYKYYASRAGKTPNLLLSTFSIHSNAQNLFHILPNSDSPHVISCLHGIRSLSVIYIVLGHKYFLMTTSPNINGVEVTDSLVTPLGMFLRAPTVAVDTFFFISGFLVILTTFKKMRKNGGQLNVPIMYFHRYLRLTPVLALTVLFCATLYHLIGDGPLWNRSTRSYQFCVDSWWTNLLYIQNYASANRMCLGHSWYLAVDTQLYFISPLILITIWKWKKKGLAAVFVVALLLVACLFSIIMVNKLPVLDLSRDRLDVMRKVYYSTHTRTSPWFIGIFFGYFVYTRNGRRLTLPRTVQLLCWTFSFAMFLVVVMALYPKSQPNASSLTPLEGAFYLSLSRIAWPLALCWIIFVCINGNGEPLNKFLSASLWQPISKLSYSLYICHLIIEDTNIARLRTNTYFSIYDVILGFWADLAISILVSIVMFISIEAPVAGIEKYLFSRNKNSGNETLTKNDNIEVVRTIS